MFLIFLISAFFSPAFGQSDYSEPNSAGIFFPNVEISRTGFWSQNLCLNQLAPEEDSCEDININFPSMGVSIVFHYDYTSKWSYTGTLYDRKNISAIPIRVVINADETGVLQSASVTLDSAIDSNRTLSLDLQITNDSKAMPDTMPLLNYSITRNTYLCKPQAKTITDRKFSYPPGYMRRDPLLNYPELSIFHYGSAVHMPSSESIVERGQMIFEYHILHPGKLKYENLKNIAKREAWTNRHLRRKSPKQKKKRTKPRLVKFNPI